MNACDLLEQVRHIAVEAGRRILDVYEQGFEVEHKGDGSPLTAADSAAQAVIAKGLAALDSKIPLLSEEATAADYAVRKDWQRYWLVDPLDGTKEFINRNGEFTVNIALIEAGRPVLGVVYVPVLGQLYSACRGGGAFRQHTDRKPEPIRARRYAGGKPVVVASRSHAGKETEAMLRTLGEHDVVSMGSSLKFCLVATGTADVYPRLGPTMEWDTAAAQCVVEEAGGTVTDIKGRPLVYNKPDLHNPWFIVAGPGETEWRRFVPPLPPAG